MLQGLLKLRDVTVFAVGNRALGLIVSAGSQLSPGDVGRSYAKLD
jgi:hypothetical protein